METRHKMMTPSRRAAVWLWSGLGHAVGTTLTAAGLLWALLPTEMAVAVVRVSALTPALREHSIEQFGLLLALAACVWALLVIGYRLGREQLSGPKRVRLSRSRGSVITETLILMPIFFLLIFGLAQLSINLVGGILANIAGYQASRTAWLWQPEESAGRMGTSSGEAQVRARIAAGLVMAPIAPADYLSAGSAAGELSGSFPDQAKAMRKGLSLTNAVLNGASSATGADLGGLGGLADIAIGVQSYGTRTDLTFYSALGESSFRVRGLRKFTRAFLCSQVSIVEEDGKIGASLTYHHYQGMPYVGKIMAGNGFLRLPDMPSSENGNKMGYYIKYKRKYMFQAQQAKPNPNPPDNNFFADPPEFDQGDADSQIRNGAGGGF